AGTQPAGEDLAKLERFRQQFGPFFETASTQRASAETSLRKSLKLSLAPQSGVVLGVQGTAILSVQTAQNAPLAIRLQTANDRATLAASVTIPAGATSVSFTITGTRAGVEEVAAVPADGSYETAVARVQVADAPLLKLEAVSGDRQVARGGG